MSTPDIPPQQPVVGKTLAADQARQNVDLEDKRTVRAERLETDTEAKAIALAVKTALREQHVDNVLLSHTQRLDQISGSISRLDTSVDHIKDSLYTTDKKMDTFIAVGNAVAHKSISSRTFVMGVLAIVIPGFGYILTTILHL